MSYLDFVSSKHIRHGHFGFEPGPVNEMLHDWQQLIVRWACQKGTAALFCDCGLGKTPMQLEWARQVVAHTGSDVLILAPLAVNRQTIREGEKFGIEVHGARSQDEIKPGINVTNYEMLDHFDTSAFAGVVLDESSILKAFMGKTKRCLIESFSRTPYRICCTATPAPNDHTELGNHAEFLGILTLQEMQSRWFVNDGFDANAKGFRLKGHAEDDFWRWVASWAVCISSPADLGFYSTGYDLPELRTIPHIVDVEDDAFKRGMLIDVSGISATQLHDELRRSSPARADHTAGIINASDSPALVWCHTNDEADELMRRIPGAQEVRGSMAFDRKSKILDDFTNGNLRVLVTKPRIAGWGLNWQHCNLMVTVGPSYSFESRYQAVRRCWRFGQEREVFDHVVMSRRESSVFNAATVKEKRHNSMSEAVRRVGHELSHAKHKTLLAYQAGSSIKLPGFLRGAA